MVGAFVFIQVSGLSSEKDASNVHKALHAIPGVKTVHFLMGPTDVVAYIEAADQAAVFASVGKMRAVKGVATTDTRLVMPM